MIGGLDRRVQSRLIGGDGIPVTLTSATWDPGDGSGPQAITFSNSRVLELTHTYTGSDSTTFFATIAVNDGTTTATDTFKVQIVARSLDSEVNMAVDRALWHNYAMTLAVDALPYHPRQALDRITTPRRRFIILRL